MLRKMIPYTDFDGNQGEYEAYFNLTKTECMDLDLEYEEEGGLLEHLKNLFKDRVNGEIPRKPAVDFIKLLVERAYGVRPKEDRSLFLKEDEDGKPLVRKFKQHPAYDAFVYALLSGEEPLDDFAAAVLPNVSDVNMDEAKKRLREEGFGDLLPKETQTV